MGLKYYYWWVRVRGGLRKSCILCRVKMIVVGIETVAFGERIGGMLEVFSEMEEASSP